MSQPAFGVGAGVLGPQNGQYQEPQILLVLAGLPGSGKSTFAHALEDSSEGSRRWLRASQDDTRSKRRQEVEDTVYAALAGGNNVVVDRVDFNPEQRAHFVRIGQGFNPRPLICCLVITASDATLRARLAARTDHPTLTSEEMALDVLRHMKRQWVAPSYREGFDRILTLREDEQPPLWDAASLQVVLDRLARSQPRNSPWSGGRGRGRGQGGDSYRGTFPGRGGYTRGAYPRHESGLDSRREQGAARARPPHGQQRGNQDGQPPRWGMTNTRPPMHAPFASNSASARTGSQYNGQARSGSSIQEETGPSGALQTPATLKPAPI